MSRLSNSIAVISPACVAGKALVQHRRRQEFEIPDPKLAAFVDEDDLEIEIRSKIVALLQVFHTDPLSLRENTCNILGARGVPCAASTYCIK